jgi:Putative beta-barrel porin-2, OmpL-like. bbp2
MKSLLKAFSAVALAAAIVSPVRAGTEAPADQKDLKKALEDQGINYVETAQKGITLSGYVDTSYTQQFAGSGTHPFLQSTVATPTGTSANLRQFDNQADGFNINAVKIALEKALPDKNDWAAGFRIDTIYGEDAKFLNDTAITGTAANTSGLALEQALVKFRIPVGNGLDIYAGKFVTFLGYEVIESPANPNFSRGLLFTNAIPLTHTGIYADYKFNDTFEAKFGVVDGWNNSTSPTTGVAGFGAATSDEAFGGKAITGQLNINAPGKNANITQSFIYSPNNEVDIAVPTGSSAPTTSGLFVYDIWGNWTPTFDKGGNTTLGFNIDYGYDSFSWYGAALYAQYKFSKLFSLSGRGEYLHSDENAGKFGAGGFATSTGGFQPASQDDYSLTLTASFAVWDNLLTRVEYRFDDLSKGTTGINSQVQNEISAEAVYSF